MTNSNVQNTFFKIHPTFTGEFTSTSHDEGVFDSGCNTLTHVSLHGDVLRKRVVHTDSISGEVSEISDTNVFFKRR